MSQTPAAPSDIQLDGQMFLFRKPELLTKDKHAGLGVSRPKMPFGFCAGVRAVPIVLAEIASAQRHYPIIFSDTNNPLPMAVVGLIDEVNLFVDDNGEWDQSVYIPGYIRRYPFALAGDKSSERMAMIIDAEFEGITETPETPFFQEGGEPSEAMTQAMDFCRTYERDRMVTIDFAKKFAEYDLLTTQVAQYTPQGGEPQPFAQYVNVEEKRLNELSDEKFLELRKSNLLPVIHAAMMSMGNWRSLMDRRVRRFNLAPDQVLQPMQKQ